MSMLAIVTFDLHGAHPRSYTKIKRRLSHVRLEKFIRSKKSRHKSGLPANTYAVMFTGKWSKKSSAELRDHLRKKVKEIISDEGLSADILVVVGKDWAWGLGKVK